MKLTLECVYIYVTVHEILVDLRKQSYLYVMFIHYREYKTTEQSSEIAWLSQQFNTTNLESSNMFNEISTKDCDAITSSVHWTFYNSPSENKLQAYIGKPLLMKQ